ncbi:hypothetical protein BST61_g7420 [Cercospora zeina]
MNHNDGQHRRHRWCESRRYARCETTGRALLHARVASLQPGATTAGRLAERGRTGPCSPIADRPVTGGGRLPRAPGLGSDLAAGEDRRVDECAGMTCVEEEALTRRHSRSPTPARRRWAGLLPPDLGSGSKQRAVVVMGDVSWISAIASPGPYRLSRAAQRVCACASCTLLLLLLVLLFVCWTVLSLLPADLPAYLPTLPTYHDHCHPPCTTTASACVTLRYSI